MENQNYIELKDLEVYKLSRMRKNLERRIRKYKWVGFGIANQA